MGDYPNSDEEFELMYGDELELFNEQNKIDPITDKNSKREFNFDGANAPSTSKTISQNDTVDNLTTDVSETVLSQDIVPVNKNQNISKVLSTNKRTIDELFGDIDDILYDNQPKKHKGDKLDELALIEHIIQLRKLEKEKVHTVGMRRDVTPVDSTERDKNNLSYRVPKYPFVGLTRYNGERVYVRFHSEEFEKDECERLLNECSLKGVLGDNFKTVWKEANEIINRNLNSDLMQTEGDDVTMVEENTTDKNSQLWADLYKPRKYLELLSDEGTNRITLRWLKMWDKVVFNRKPKVKVETKQENFGKWNNKTRELNLKLDEDGRPQYKVALLCGPPGLGKTTLAHMVAKHAGYNVVEINASDDRSTESFKTSLENATQMRSVVDQQKRPNCLVFDEIDGAPSSSIDYLVKFISGNATSTVKKSKNKKTIVLKRPIICICNDAYAPALRPLRQIAFVINFPTISSAKLAERLMEIARREHIKTNIGAMMALAEKSNNDIRSCLSVLQFFKAENKPVLLTDIYKTSVGQKDMQKGLFTVWQEIFQIERSKVKISEVSGDSQQQYDMSLKSRMVKILQTISSFGDYERVAQGVFENYVKLNVKDSTFERICLALEWFCYTDILNKQISTLQNYSLSSYLPFAFVVWHFVFASLSWQKLQYPRQGYEAKVKLTRQKALIKELIRGMQPKIRAYINPISLAIDVLPMVSRIIVPQLRPVSVHLYTDQEKEHLLHVVNIMIDYNLNYVQERNADGYYTFILDPNLDEVTTFTGLPTKKSVSYSNKQLIAREIEMEKMRRADAGKGGKVATKEKQPDLMSPPNSHLPNHLQKLKARKVKSPNAPTVTKDFFGRIITKELNTSKLESEIKNDIWYKYKEGFSNAVRKRINISQLK